MEQQIHEAMHISGWHIWAGGTGALGIVIGLGKWLFSALNGKANSSSVKKLFDKVEDNQSDIADLKKDVAVTREKVDGIEKTVDKVDGKLDQMLDIQRECSRRCSQILARRD